MIQLGNDKVSRLMIGGNVMVNQDDVWLPCEVNSDFSGAPILMHYDNATGKTMLVGQATMLWDVDKGYWDDVLLTLPEGYHFTDSSVFLLFFDNGSREDYQSFSINGPELRANFKWPFSDPKSGSVQIVFGNIGQLYSTSKTFATTTSIAPD